MPRPKQTVPVAMLIDAVSEARNFAYVCNDDDAALVLGVLRCAIGSGDTASLREYVAGYVASKLGAAVTPASPAVFTGSIAPGRN